ncbi:hypothetical protein MGYG_00256 [Nannizzia gypsea CBS 118893]|uniref:GST N-terminal domain-containing protein n=1 Tax=Arthroderma gypseum (strain ATCC MYA-4604 / CBS 118893) TaxID=535722 RepID=E5QYC2_ARTGP|nr:hypothetical protein MGYG_00256 [Nannizzia gypsea CBS 118893]EFQ97214.1 hypothetical protein MGYG_00256 [Nannizzia gypsea CBS 118893]
MTSSSAPESILTFYDIALAPPVIENAASPNPWKSRYALNFKKIPYKTTWVPLPDVSAVRAPLNIPASRTFADGSPYHTLPMLSDPATGQIVGDSFEIAVYLQRQYPSSGGDLFPKQDLSFAYKEGPVLFAPIAESKVDETMQAYVKFNTNVDAAFTAHVPLMVHGLPFDPATADQSKAEFSRRAGIPWEDLSVKGDKKDEMLKSYEQALTGLAEMYRRDTTGPFLLGNRPSYADFIVGGWLRMSRATLPRIEWEALENWHDGIFGQLHQALKAYAQID